MEKIKMQLNSQFDQITKIEKLIEDVCSEYKINQDCYGNMLVALTEAVNNAIQHGNKFDSAKKINILFEPQNQILKFEISDEGDGFDFNQVPDPTAPENLEKPNGRGVFLMRHLADDVKYFDNGRKVELTFKACVN